MNLSAFASIVFGAALATLGGFLATQANARIDRRRQLRTAALLFGEILATLHVLLTLIGREAPDPQQRGVLRLGLGRAIQRELDVYSRNRESLSEFPDPALRAALHSFMVRLSVAAEDVVERRTPEHATPAEAPGGPATRDPAERGLRVLLERHRDLPGLLAQLVPYGAEKFGAYAAFNEDLGRPTPASVGSTRPAV